MVPMQTAAPFRRSQTEVYLNVLRALMLRDMRTRFGGGAYFGYAAVVLWPVAHIFLIVTLYTWRGIPSPMSLSTTLFIATGAVPCLMFKYISREVMKSVMANRPLTYYPQVKLIDVLFARIMVEIVTGFLGLIIVFGIMLALRINPVPAEPFVAITAYLAAILLGIGIGSVNVGIVSFFPGWVLGYTIFAIILYITSGVMFLPTMMPTYVYDILKYNPMVHIIEWVRLAYEPKIGFQVDYAYIFLWAFGSLTIGLLLERHLVRKMR